MKRRLSTTKSLQQPITALFGDKVRKTRASAARDDPPHKRQKTSHAPDVVPAATAQPPATQQPPATPRAIRSSKRLRAAKQRQTTLLKPTPPPPRDLSTVTAADDTRLDVSKDVPKEASKDVSEDVSEDISNDVPNVSNDASRDASADASAEASADAPAVADADVSKAPAPKPQTPTSASITATTPEPTVSAGASTDVSKAPASKPQAPTSATTTATTPQPKHAQAGLQQTKKKWRLAEIVRKEREARRVKEQATPTFSLRPVELERVEKTTKPGGVGASRERASRTSCVHLPGGEALLYDRSLLPASHGQLLDTFASIETAMPLLRTRQVRASVTAVREIVEKATRRKLTLRSLAQLVRLVPEAIAVTTNPHAMGKRMGDKLVVRLDAPEEAVESAARVRKALLHRRLLEHVRKSHAAFLRARGLEHASETSWHATFDVERDVAELPCGPLSGVESKADAGKKDVGVQPLATKAVRKEGVEAVRTAPGATDSSVATASGGVTGQKGTGDAKDGGSDCIPMGLLARVRAREQTREAHAVKVEQESKSHRSLLSKLPVTMDSVNAVLREEKRVAMGWVLLVNKVAKVHPKKWSKADIEEQLNAIVKLGGVWCTKAELQSSRGGYAFRVVSAAAFQKARETISQTESYDGVS